MATSCVREFLGMVAYPMERNQRIKSVSELAEHECLLLYQPLHVPRLKRRTKNEPRLALCSIVTVGDDRLTPRR